MSSATTLSTPQNEVEALMQQIASENDLDITDQLKDLNPTTASIREDAERKKEDDLSRRYTYVFHREFN
jgi:charged multivesicular body protein 1